MKTMWDDFGFTQTPYRVTPLEANAEDYKLSTSRDEEGAEFITMMDSAEGSFVVVSGDIGIGKTSFVNVQQHRLANGLTGWGPKLLPCLRITPLSDEDTPPSLARRIVHDVVENIEAYCARNAKTVPSECQAVRNWLSHRPVQSGYQITIWLLGVGQSMTLPPVADATLETWRTILETIAAEVRKELGVSGFIVVLDNADAKTLTQSQLARLLMSYRDTLLVIKGIWWVLIGQSDLYKQIDTIDRRVSQRISGNGVELSHFGVEKFHDIIERRVRAYRNRSDALSPLSKNVHDILFRAACGEIRFVFDTANTLVQKIVTEVRQGVEKSLGRTVAAPYIMEQVLTQALKEVLIDNQIPDQLSTRFLKMMTDDATSDLRKNPDNVRQVQRIRGDLVSEDEYERFGFTSAEEFSTTFLAPLRDQGFLGRQAAPSEQSYRLKGFLALCREFGLLG